MFRCTLMVVPRVCSSDRTNPWLLYLTSSKLKVKNNETVKYLRTTSQSNRIFEVPSEYEVKQLKEKYANPKKLVFGLLKPLIVSGQILEPQTEFIPKLNGLYWKAKLQVRWPHTMTFTGTHQCINQAEENAYLLACQLYKSVGLLYTVDTTAHPVTESYVFNLLERMVDKSKLISPPPSMFQLKSFRCRNKEGKLAWRSELCVPWPFVFTVTATAPTIQASHYVTCLLACIKLKLLHLLTSDNGLAEQHIQKLTKHLRSYAPPSVEEFDPHYQIFVDASRIGFGAYLLTKADDRVRWISESWPEHFKAEQDWPVTNKFDSCFYEFYALIAACYTWKHKFVNKRVLCWSDNQHAVRLVNSAASHVHDVRQIKRYSKLFQIMVEMSQTYNIHLHAHYVNRVHNTAADLLSRVEVGKFKEMIPEAEVKAKKTKKLLFLNPLIPREYDPRYKGVS